MLNTLNDIIADKLVEQQDLIVNRLDIITPPEAHRQTDRQTDGLACPFDRSLFVRSHTRKQFYNLVWAQNNIRYRGGFKTTLSERQAGNSPQLE